MTGRDKEVAVDPVVFVLTGAALRIYFEKKFPHGPYVEHFQEVAKAMTKEQRSAAYAQAKILNDYTQAAMKAFQ
jgi:hypothetical protein